MDELVNKRANHQSVTRTAHRMAHPPLKIGVKPQV